MTVARPRGHPDRASVATAAKRLRALLSRLGSTVTAVAVVTTVTAVTAVTVHAAVPGFDEVKAAWSSTEGLLLDRHGTLLHEMRVVEQGRRLPWTTLGEISPAALATIVRAEDKRFYAHGGIDWVALSDAALDTLLFSRPRGASTITMQLAAHLDPALRPSRQKRTVGQKWDQMSAARELEKAWTKRQILEAYLNLSTFRGELQGIAATSRALFGKQPDGLDVPESLLLAVLLRGPNAAPAGVARRACLLAAATKSGVDCPRLQALAQAGMPARPNLAPRVALAPHVARALLSADRRRAQSTLDAALQAHANELLRQQLANLAERHVADAAALVVDNRTGEVLAYVGNAGENPATAYVDGARAPRQAGSTLKPFLYALAFEKKWLTAASLIDDSPVNLVTPTGLYVPQNYDRDFRGLVSARTALSSSLNVPAVRTLMLAGADAFAERLRELGFDEIAQDGDYYGYSLALGSAEVTLWQLVNAYRTLANGGRWSPMTLVAGASTVPSGVVAADAAWIVGSILADPVARSVGFGLENPLASHHWSAVKTGTSKDMRDNWCVGFTARYTIGVWVGNFDGSPMHDVSGVTGAAPVWAELVDYLHRDLRSIPPARPARVVARQVRFDGATEAPREEYFLPGTDLGFVVPRSAATAHASIAYPGDGSIIALDPDIPDKVQRVRFIAVPALAGQTWRLDGAPLEGDDQAPLWAPRPGHHQLELVDTTGAHLDRVRFEVRGAEARPPRGRPGDWGASTAD